MIPWSLIDVRASSECWVWRGNVDRDGYPVWGSGRVHRMMLSEALGRPLVRREVARHTCDRPSCCNPLHLVPGTQAENVNDRVVRGRSAAGPRNGRNVLSESDAPAIYFAAGSLAAIGRAYGVSKWTVRPRRRSERTKACELQSVLRT